MRIERVEAKDNGAYTCEVRTGNCRTTQDMTGQDDTGIELRGQNTLMSK